MAILLHNLLARAPRLNDADAVTKLLMACDTIEDGVSDYTEEDLLIEWQKPGFNLATDAWVIVTNKGRLAGYASTSADSKHVSVAMKIAVHPDYRGRGIGTLLLRLAEARARQYVKYAPAGLRVTLNSRVNSANQVARNLLEHEGYTLVSSYWRIIIVIDEAISTAYDEQRRRAKHTFSFDVACPSDTGTMRIYEPSGRYVVRQYDVYEKELRAGEVSSINELLDGCLINA